jgi:plastocyanin
MKTRRTATALAVAAACGVLAVAVQVKAGGEKVSFPEGFEKGVMYATLDRYDIKQFRELYTSKEAVDAVRAGRPIPSGTVLTIVQYKAKTDDKGNPVKGADGHFVKDGVAGYGVMEKRAGWGTEYPEDLRNGEWEYQAFTADRKVNEKANLRACFQCHKPHEKQDFVMSLASLSGTGLPKSVERKSGPGIVGISEFLFGPEKIAVQVGQVITWTNTDDSPHQVTVQGASTVRTPVILKGQSAAVVFNNVGDYDYICGLHPNMKGKIEVTR